MSESEDNWTEAQIDALRVEIERLTKELKYSQMAATAEANRVDELTQQLAAEKERADYAWKNVKTIEAARVEEMRKRDVAEAELTAVTAQRDSR